MLVTVAGVALQVVLDEKLAEEGGVLVLYRDEPWQHHGKVEDDAGPPQGAINDPPIAPEKSECEDNDAGKKGRDWPLGESGEAGKEVDVVEPEL